MKQETKMRDTNCSQLRSIFCFLLEINCDLWTLSCGRPTHPDVQPHIRRHPQSDRQIGKCITGVSPQAHARWCACAPRHTQKADTPRHSQPLALFTHGHYSSAAVNPIIPQIPVSWDYFMCFAEIIVLGFFSPLPLWQRLCGTLNNAF